MWNSGHTATSCDRAQSLIPYASKWPIPTAWSLYYGAPCLNGRIEPEPSEVDWVIDLRDRAVTEVELDEAAHGLPIDQIQSSHLKNQERFSRASTVALTDGEATRYIKEFGQITSR
jgi:hypothetical protein